MRKAMRWVIAGLVLTTTAGCKPLDDVMVGIFGRSMRDQRSFDPYENTRPPPEHAISFSSSNFPAGPDQFNLGEPESTDVVPFTQADMVPIGTGNAVVAGLVNPYPEPDSAQLARGKVLFERNCAVCHGFAGIGAEARIAAKHPTVAAYNLAGSIVQGYTDQYIYGMIRVGRGLMPDYGPRIPHFDRWKIVNYVRELQRQYNAQQGAED